MISLVTRSFVMFLSLDDLFDLSKVNLGRQKVIRDTDRFNHYRRFLISSLQQHIIAVFVHLVAGRSALFRDVVVPQRKQRALILAIGSCGDSSRNLIRLEPFGSFLADNVLHSADLIDSAFEVSFVVIRSEDSISG